MVSVIDAAGDFAIDRLEADFLRHARSTDAAGFLPQRCLIPTRVLPLYARTYSASSSTTDQIQVGVPYVFPSSRNGEMWPNTIPL